MLTGLSTSAQQLPDTVSSLQGIEIETSVDRADILIGDLITYKLIITYDSTYELIPPPLGANLGAFDVKDYHPDIITLLEGGRRQSENIFILSTFTTGDYVIPPLPILFNMPDGGRKVVLSESVPIKVRSLLESAGDSLDIRSLKAQFEFKRDLTPYYLWGGLGLLLLIALVVFLWLRLRRRKEEVEPVDLRPPWEIAFEKLALLKEKGLLEDVQFKQFYIELTEISRAYLGRMYLIEALDMTTEELLSGLKRLQLADSLRETLDSFFNHADLVKFARFVPDTDRAEEDLDVVHDVVEALRADFQSQKAVDAEAVIVGKRKHDTIANGVRQ
jgi:hypothetical protein